MIAKRTPELEAQAREMLSRGLTYRQIAPILGVSHTTIRRWIDEEYRERQAAYMRDYLAEDRAAKNAERIRQGDRLSRLVRAQGPHFKRTPELDEKAQRLKAMGFTYAGIGHRLRVHPHTVRYWLDKEFHDRHLAAAANTRRRRIPEPAE